jgi:hypothetical protein
VARFYFDLSGRTALIDQDGEDLPDVEAAEATAGRILAEVLGLQIPALRRGEHLVVKARNADGRTVYEIEARAGGSSAG